MNPKQSLLHYPLKHGTLSAGWVAVTIRDIALDVRPGFASGIHNDDGHGIPHLRPMNIHRNGHLDLDVVKYVPASRDLRLIPGDVLFNNTNSPELVGKTTVFSREGDWAFSNHMTRLRLCEGLCSAFVAYQLHFLWMAGYFRHRCTNHVNQASIASSTLSETVPLLVAPLAEQHRIVAAIETQFSRLDAGVAALKRARANLKRYRAAVLKAACEGRLVPTEAELARAEGRDYEPASVLLERTSAETSLLGRRGNEKVNIQATDGWHSLPEGWSWAPFCRLISYLRNGVSIKPDGMHGTAILRISAVRPLLVNSEDIRFLPVEPEALRDYLVDPGDLLFTRYNGNPDLVGVCGVVGLLSRPTAHPDKLIRAKLLPELAEPRFLQIVLNTGPSRNFLRSRVRTTAGQAGISGADLRAIPVPLPPLAEQRRIVAEVERRLSVIERLEGAVAASLKRAERLRQAILKRAFEGRLVPQDPSDEPASALLERIRAERAAAAANGAGRGRRAGAGRGKGGVAKSANPTTRQEVLEL